MTKFKYKALKENNTIVDGEIDATDYREARNKIRHLGFIPTKVYTEEVSLETQTVVETKEKEITRLNLSQKISFTSELQTLLSSGIPILDALYSIETHSPDIKIQVICSNISKAIKGGMTFAESLNALYGKVFGSVYTSLVKTGEEAGELEVTLDRMLLMLRKQDNIKGKIINASIYPGVLIVMMFGILMVFAKFVFPAFAGVMSFNGTDLPIMAEAIMGAMNFLNQYWWLILIGIGAFSGFTFSFFQNPKVKKSIDDILLKIPAVSDFVEYVNLSNFMTVLHISYEAGLPIMSGLELANKAVGNHNIKTKIYNAIDQVRAGKSLTEAFQRSRAVPDTLMSMISAGETSGSLGKMLRDAAIAIDRKVDMALETLTRLFEPTVIIIMGIAVLFIAIAFYQAYFGMLGSLF